MKEFFRAVFLYPFLRRAYKQYSALVLAEAKIVYARRRKNADLAWAREYLTRQYLEKHALTYFEWVRKIHDR
jgi:hypothetical protein